MLAVEQQTNHIDMDAGDENSSKIIIDQCKYVVVSLNLPIMFVCCFSQDICFYVKSSKQQTNHIPSQHSSS